MSSQNNWEPGKEEEAGAAGGVKVDLLAGNWPGFFFWGLHHVTCVYI